NGRSTAGRIVFSPTELAGAAQSSCASLACPGFELSGQKSLATAFTRSLERMAFAASLHNIGMKICYLLFINFRVFSATALKQA
ncbi:hypothetical protein, partial [Parasedimentitalea psychrophila]|uniref:hypothetical protein n=1 Tax=Parasedimentitalea psychrophila TaxID=2997337 RepID=UPI0022EB08A9